MPFDLFALQMATSMAQTHAAEVRRTLDAFDSDAQQERRLERNECKRCFYLWQRVCGQAFTEYKCIACGSDERWHNTCCPKLCIPCAHRYRVCRRCTGDISMRKRKALEPRKRQKRSMA